MFVYTCAVMRTAYVYKQFVIFQVSQRMVYQSQCPVLEVWHSEFGARQPLPVTEMSQHRRYRLSAPKHLLYFVHTSELYHPAHLLVCCRQQFDGFHKVVTEPVIELLLYHVSLLLRFLWKGVFQVFLYQFSAIAHHIEHYHKNKV